MSRDSESRCGREGGWGRGGEPPRLAGRERSNALFGKCHIIKKKKKKKLKLEIEMNCSTKKKNLKNEK